MLLQVKTVPLPPKTQGKYSEHRYLEVKCDHCGKLFEIHRCVKKASQKRKHYCCREHLNLGNRTSEETIKSELLRIHNGDVSLVGPYVSATHKCEFLDIEYGSWKAMPYSVFAGRKHPQRAIDITTSALRACAESSSLKRKQTCLTKYGVDSHLKLKEFQDKIAKSTNKTTIMQHWKTKEELACVGSYEVATVNWLNSNAYDYQWQPGPFTMPDGRTYRPDVLITSGPFVGVYVEVKGYFRDRSRQKWEWFKREHPNDSELWDKQRLIALGILAKK